MADGERTCPGCGSAAMRKDGRDRRGQQRCRCGACPRRFTALTGTPFAGDRFPPEIIALAVRWSLRFRLSDADVAERLAGRGVRVDPSTLFAWVRAFAPPYEDAARSCRRAVGGCWSVDETYTSVAGKPAYVYRAIDGRGQVVDVDVSARRATADAAACFRRAIEATGVIPDAVTTDRAATYPPALAVALPPVAHETGKRVQQRIERDHQHRKGTIAPDARVQNAHRGARALPGPRLPPQPAGRLRRSRAPGRRRGSPAAAAGGAGVGDPDRDASGPLTPAVAHRPGPAPAPLRRVPHPHSTTQQKHCGGKPPYQEA